MDKIQIEKIIRLGKKHTYQSAPDMYLDKIERDLYRVIKFDNENEYAITVLAKFLFERRKYKEALIQFNSLLKNNKNMHIAYYGIYKCSIMLNDYSNSYQYLSKYIESKSDDIIKSGTKIIFSLHELILKNKFPEHINENEIFLMNRIENQELLVKYQKLIELYNLRDYEKCILLADECEKISREKNIFIEFVTLKTLLNEANIILKRNIVNNIDNVYENLKLAIESKDFKKTILILYYIPKINIKNEKLIYNSIYILIKNNYLEEAKEILDMFIKGNKNKIFINTLYKVINNQIELNNLSERELESYKIAIEKGHQYYQDGNLEYAYYTYKFGEYTTGNSIFLYYIGKILFKLKRYNEALDYLNQYVKIGTDKLNKAYLYLATIYRNKRNYKKAIYYGDCVEKLDKIFATNYEMYYIGDNEDPEVDLLKMNLQNKKAMYEDCFSEELNNSSICKVKKI